MFAIYTNSLSRGLAAADPDLVVAQTTNPNTTTSASMINDSNITTTTTTTTHPDPAKFDKLMDNLKRFEDNFSRHLKILLDALNYLAATETVVFLSLCARLSMAGEGMGGSFGSGSGSGSSTGM